MDVFSLYKESFRRRFSPGEEYYLDEITTKFPYFALPRYLKAKSQPNAENIFAASAYSVNRRLLKSYLEGKTLMTDFSATMANEEANIVFPELSVPRSPDQVFSIIDFETVSFPYPQVEGFFSIHPDVESTAEDPMAEYKSVLAQKSSGAENENGKMEADLDSVPTQLSENDLIDSFLQNQPKIRRRKPEESNNGQYAAPSVVTESIREDDDMVTETLARLHLLQNNKPEAIRIYEKLSLLYPEKSAYFGAQIKKIKES